MTVIWHNPRCSKSRQTLAILQEQGEDICLRSYLEDGPTAGELSHVCALLGITPIDLMRTGEALFRELGLSKTDDDARLIAAMAEHPRLVERPVVIKGDKAALGRPPEAVLDIL